MADDKDKKISDLDYLYESLDGAELVVVKNGKNYRTSASSVASSNPDLDHTKKDQIIYGKKTFKIRTSGGGIVVSGESFPPFYPQIQFNIGDDLVGSLQCYSGGLVWYGTDNQGYSILTTKNLAENLADNLPDTIVDTTSDQRITGEKTFHSAYGRGGLKVSGQSVFYPKIQFYYNESLVGTLQCSDSGVFRFFDTDGIGSEILTAKNIADYLPDTIVDTTSNQTITGEKTFHWDGSSGGLVVSAPVRNDPRITFMYDNEKNGYISFRMDNVLQLYTKSNSGFDQHIILTHTNLSKYLPSTVLTDENWKNTVIPSGNTGQVLTRTANGWAFEDAPSGGGGLAIDPLPAGSVASNSFISWDDRNNKLIWKNLPFYFSGTKMYACGAQYGEGSYGFSAGRNAMAESDNSIALGYETLTQAMYECAVGRFNKARGETWESSEGKADYTLFTVGNGTNGSRHNAFEVRQNGDVYIPNTKAGGLYYNAPMINLQDKIAELEAKIAALETQLNN